MDTENKKNKKEKTAGMDFGFNPEDFKRMSEMIGKCFPAQDEMPDCSAIMKAMMKNCCGTKAENTQTDHRPDTHGSGDQQI